MKLPLQHIAFELIDACNLDCRYCYNIWKMPGVERIPFNSYSKAVQTLKQLFKQADIQNVAFTGGEPFLAERMVEVALFCRMEGKSVTIITNGFKGTEKEYKQLLKMGVRLFELPIHSARSDIHDEITRTKDSWKKSISSIQTLIKLGAYIVPVIVVTKLNVEILGETLDFIYGLGLKRIMMNRYNIGGCGLKNPTEVSATPDELRKAFVVAEQKSIDLGLSITSNVCSPICLFNPKDYPHIGFGHCSCDIFRKPVTLDINGNIRVCNHSPVVAGNIYEKELGEILFSGYVKSWNEIVPDFCNECEHWEKCMGGCRAASEQCGLGLSHVDPVMTLFQ